MEHAIHPTALFRLSVLGPLASRDHLTHGEFKQIIRSLAAQTYHIPNSRRVHLSEKTIENWYYAWRRQGVDGLIPKGRKDKGQSQLPETIQQVIVALKKENGFRSINTIIRLLEMQGLINKHGISRASVHRLLKSHHLSTRDISDVQTIERRAFEALSAGDIWYGDVMYGPRIQTPLGMKKTYLVSIMDDASRLVCHSAFCLDETALSIEFVLKEALLKRGMPKRFVIDNGAAYRAQTLQSICARLNIRLVYCRPYEPEGKGKLERFHRTFREQFLTELDIKTIQNLDELNTRLWIWIERIYHQTPHGALPESITPNMRFQRDLLKIKPLGHLAMQLDNYFYHRIQRQVKKDGTLSYNGTLYEVSFEYVGQYVFLVIDPHEKKPKWIESMKYERLGDVHLLDKQANNQKKRHRPNLSIQTQEPSKSKTSLVELAYEQMSKTLDITSFVNYSKEKK